MRSRVLLFAFVALGLGAAGARASGEVSAGAADVDASPRLTVSLEAPIAVSTVTGPTGVGTALSLWPGIRGTALYALDGPWFVGGDVGLAGSFESAGTADVSITRVLGAVEGRALFGAGFGGRFVRMLPYVYAGPFVGLGAGLVSVEGAGPSRPLASPGLRLGGGSMLRLGPAQVRLDLGVGLRELRPEITSSFSLGAAF